jgi:hypothetical protein
VSRQITVDVMRRLSEEVLEGRKNMEDSFGRERAALVRVLEQVMAAIDDCIPAISSKLPFGAPYDTGIKLRERKEEALYLAEEGFFFVYSKHDGISSLKVERVVEDRWPVSDIVEALHAEMKANLDGQLRKVKDVERTVRKVGAVAELLQR